VGENYIAKGRKGLMPNHITNRLTITGDHDEVAKLFAQINGDIDEHGEEMLIDFGKLTPMPESLNIESGSVGQCGLELYKAHCKQAGHQVNAEDIAPDPMLSEDEQHRIRESLLLGEKYFNNIRDNWGTKWNAYSQRRIDENCIEFQTAWSGVPNLIENLSVMFPSLTIAYMYADEDWGSNLGEYAFEGGVCVDVNIPDYDTPEARSIATELLGEVYQDDDEDEMEM
jgi:hypothetical protein